MKRVLFLFSNEKQQHTYAPWVSSVSDYGYIVDDKVGTLNDVFNCSLYDFIVVDVPVEEDNCNDKVNSLEEFSNSKDIIKKINLCFHSTQ